MTAQLEDVKDEVYDQWGSLNTAVEPTKLQKQHTPRAINCLPDEKPGSILTGPGYTKVGDLPSGNPCRFMYTFTKSDGTSIVLVSDNATVWKTVDFVTFTSLITGLSSSFQLRAITVRNKVWLTNGNDSVRTYDGTSVVVLDGTASTPNVPKGKFIALWQERVWVGDIPNSRSGVRFSALVDTSGNDIAPDNSAAWPTSNEIQYGQDDGDVLCGLKEYRGVLHAFKAFSIYRTDGYDEFTYNPTRTTATTGCRIMESIQERDNLLEFIGKDGVYEFDGVKTDKVSDAIESVDLSQFSFSNIQQTTASSRTKIWTSQADFTGGTLTNVTATRLVDSVVIDGYTYAADYVPNSDPDNPWTRSGNTGSTNESVASGILTMTTVTSTQAGFPSSGQTFTRNESGLSNSNGTRMKIRARITSNNTTYDKLFILIDDGTRYVILNIYGGQIWVGDTGGNITSYVMDTTSAYHVYELKVEGSTAYVYVDGTLRITQSLSNGSLGTKKVAFGLNESHPVGVSNTGTVTVDYVSVSFLTNGTAEWLSDIYHITDTISSWGAFQTDEVLNSGTITYYIRGGTSSVNCAAASWTAITSGATIGLATSAVYVQVKAVFVPASETSPELDDITINWSTGTAGTSSTQGVASIVWENRYWLAGALVGSTYNNALILRGKRVYGGPWIRLSGFNILAMCAYNGELYGAKSDSDDIVKLDTGYNLNGSALDSTWETRDEVGGPDEIFIKRWPLIIIAGQRKGNYNLTVDVSTDGGTTFPVALQKTISLSGTGRFQQELRYGSLMGKQLRVRVRTNGVDQPFEVSSIRMFWKKKNLR